MTHLNITYLDPDEGAYTLSPYTLSNIVEFRAEYLAEIVTWNRFVGKLEEKIIDELLKKEDMLERKKYPQYNGDYKDIGIDKRDVTRIQEDPMLYINNMIYTAKLLWG